MDIVHAVMGSLESLHAGDAAEQSEFTLREIQPCAEGPGWELGSLRA